ncbi:MAG: DNA alkylation repair protein [Candidatus Aminicenantes bacterium]|nr:MAG: DNA alkylation repair protein [Candidatus Aminicenantes bacterium]
MTYEEIIKKLKALSDPKAIGGMARYGITPQKTFGVSIPNLRKIAKDAGRNRNLAQKLWASDIRETRILASMIDEPTGVTEDQMERWVKDFDYWEICDQCCMNLFEKTRFAYPKATEWSQRQEEFVKRAGFVLMARLAVSDKKAEDGPFEKFFPLIKGESTDQRNFVKKAVNWALRQIGKRNLTLNKKAIRVAEEIQQMDSKAAKWNASDAIRELRSREVQERLRTKEKK